MSDDVVERLRKAANGGFTFTPSQQEAVDKIRTWFKSDDLICVLSGEAGTGKTYILRYLIKHVFKYSVCITAPTHKAVRVAENMTGVKGRTLQSLHGLRPNFNLESFNIDNVRFESLGNIYMRNYHIVIVDECSQIGSVLGELNEIRSRQYNVKILYVGDPYQIPPVNEKISKTFLHPNKIELTEIVRQEEGNPLLELFKFIRYDIRNNSSTLLNHLHTNKYSVNDKGEGYEVLNNDGFTSHVKDYFGSKNFENDVSYCRYTAFTNDSINVWNQFIRHAIIPDTSKLLSIDDLLTGYITIVNEFNEISVINSEDYIVGKIDHRIGDHGFATFKVKLLKLNKTTRDNETSVSIVDHKHETFKNFYKILNKLHYNAVYSTAENRGKAWSQMYYPFKNNNLVLRSFKLLDYDKSERGSVPKDLDYGYGLTIHKLQGSTIENIFVNLLDLCYSNGDRRYPRKDIDIRNKLIYTALSRASKKAIILF